MTVYEKFEFSRIATPSILFFVPLKYDVASHSLAQRSCVPSPECVSCSKHIEYCFSFNHVNICSRFTKFPRPLTLKEHILAVIKVIWHTFIIEGSER